MPYTLGIELTEEVVFRARKLAAAHEVRMDELAGMLRHTGNVRAAIGIYLDEYADLDELFHSSVESFIALQGCPCGGERRPDATWPPCSSATSWTAAACW